MLACEAEAKLGTGEGANSNSGNAPIYLVAVSLGGLLGLLHP